MSRLADCPLVLVASEIYVLHPATDITEQQVHNALEALRSVDSRRDRNNRVTIERIATESRGATWQLKSDDENWIMRIGPNGSMLKATVYCDPQGASRARFGALVRALDPVLHPLWRTRLGLRYTHHVRAGGDVRAYGAIIRKPLLERSAIAWHDADRIATVPETRVSLDDAVRVIFRRGFTLAPAGGYELMFLFDTDIYREDVSRADSAELLKMVDGMHQDHIRVLRTCLTDEALASMFWHTSQRLN